MSRVKSTWKWKSPLSCLRKQATNCWSAWDFLKGLDEITGLTISMNERQGRKYIYNLLVIKHLSIFVICYISTMWRSIKNHRENTLEISPNPQNLNIQEIWGFSILSLYSLFLLLIDPPLMSAYCLQVAWTSERICLANEHILFWGSHPWQCPQDCIVKCFWSCSPEKKLSRFLLENTLKDLSFQRSPPNWS